MTTSRRILLAGMAGLALAPNATTAVASTATAVGATVAEERFARMIAAAHAPGAVSTTDTERYAETHWCAYVPAARAVLAARG